MAKIVFCIVLILVGCVTSPPKTEGGFIQGVPFDGRITIDQRNELKRILKAFPENMLSVVKSISVDQKAPGICSYPDGSIVAKPYFINDVSMVWQEVAKVYTQHLVKSGSELEKEWNKVAGNVYDNQHNNLLGVKYPREGLLSEYGSCNWKWDVAEYVKEFYGALGCRITVFGYLEIAGGNNTAKDFFDTDQRYAAKLQLLLKYGFISKKDHWAFNKIFMASKN